MKDNIIPGLYVHTFSLIDPDDSLSVPRAYSGAYKFSELCIFELFLTLTRSGSVHRIAPRGQHVMDETL